MYVTENLKYFKIRKNLKEILSKLASKKHY